MSISSVSSYSDTIWEEYLEKLKKLQEQKQEAANGGSHSSEINTTINPNDKSSWIG